MQSVGVIGLGSMGLGVARSLLRAKFTVVACEPRRGPMLLRRYNPDHKVVFVGDASMGPYEITQPGGSVEYWNDEAGEPWFRRLRERFRKVAWINPNPPERWRYLQSTELVRELVDDRMYPLTARGLDEAMRFLAR